MTWDVGTEHTPVVPDTVAPTEQDTRDIREWARQAGLQVSSRGRISAEIVEKYNAEYRSVA